MRWRFVDRIEGFVPWKAIAGRKAISFEEYSLLEPFGRKGVFPETLLLECCIELVRWLVAASSEFSRVSVLSEIEVFSVETEVGMGSVLEIAAAVARRGEDELAAECTVAAARMGVAHGRIGLALLPIEEGFDAELVKGMWRELHGEA